MVLWKCHAQFSEEPGGFFIPRVGLLVRKCLALGGNIVSKDDKSSLKLYMYIYTHAYVYYSFFRINSK